MRGLIKASNYYNKLEARKDYLAACRLLGELPAPGWESLGWRRLDGLTAKLLEGTQWAGVKSETLREAARMQSEDEDRAEAQYC